MFRALPWQVTILTLLAMALPASAQLDELQERPAPNVPLRPWTQKDLDRQAALKLYALGVLCERDERLIEALGHYEESLKLDPDALPVMKALLLLYIAVDRQDESLALARTVLKEDADDYQTSYVAARLLRSRSQLKEACDVLLVGLKSPRLADRPDLHQQMEYDLAVLYERQERYAEAAAAFERSAAILDHPDELLEIHVSAEELQLRSAESHERAGRNFLEARQFDKAVTAFQQAQTIYPAGAARLNYYIAQVHVQQGNLNVALVALDNYLRGLPQGTDAYELKIAILQKLGRVAEVVPWLEKASNQDRFNVALKLLLGRHYARAGRVDQAEKLYRDLAEASPSEELYRDLFLLYVQHLPNGAEMCVKMLNAAIESSAGKDHPLAGGTSPTQARTMIGAVRENANLAVPLLKAGIALLPALPMHLETLHLFAVLADRHDLAQESELYYRACLTQTLPANLEPQLYGGLLRMLWKARRFESIIDICRTGLKQAKASNLVLLRSDLARALAQVGKHDEALTEADAAVRDARDVEKFAVRHLRVRLLLQAERWDAAEAECQALLKEFPLPGDALETHYLLSSVYSMSKRLPLAEAELAVCLKLEPNNATVNNDLGYIWADQNKNLEEAEAMIRKAIDLDRKNRQGALALGPNADKENHDNACYIDSLGWVLFRRGQLEAARKQLEYATGLPDGDDPAIWEHLGDVLEAMGQTERAEQAWQQALTFYDQGKRHKIEERYRVLQEKLRRVTSTH
jgi:tetratricopeptide (TPR) repeat protein